MSSTITFLSSSIAIRLISPPSEIKKGLISSNAFSTFKRIFSEVVIIILFFYSRATCHGGYFYCFGRWEVCISFHHFLSHVTGNFYKGFSHRGILLHSRWTTVISCFANTLHQWHFTKERYLQVGCQMLCAFLPENVIFVFW